MELSTSISPTPIPTPALPPAPPPGPKHQPAIHRVVRLGALTLLVALILLGLFRAGAEGYAAYHIRAADKALKRQNYREAKPHLEAALKVRPHSAALHLRLGRLCRQMNILDEAYEHLKTCRHLEGESEEYQLEMLMLQAQTGHIEEVYERLWPYCEQDRPEAPLIHEALVLASMPQELTQLALAQAERWLQKEPDNVQALYYKAMCVAQMGPAEEAVTMLDKALARDPDREDIQQLRGFLLAELHRYDEAIVVHENYLKNHPNDSMSLLSLARCLYGKGQLQQAKDLLSEALKDESAGAPDLWAERGKIALQMNEPEEAEKWLRRALEKDPNHMTASYHLVICLRRLGHTQEATKIENDNRRRDNDSKRVQTILTKEVANLSNPDVSGELGLLLMRNGREHAGALWVYKAVAKDRNNRTYHEVLSDYWAKYDRPDRGAAHNDFLIEYWGEHASLPAFDVSTIGLLGSPDGRGPLLTAASLFPGRNEHGEPALADHYRERLPREEHP